jgi:hypothetical protein
MHGTVPLAGRVAIAFGRPDLHVGAGPVDRAAAGTELPSMSAPDEETA